MMNHRLRQFLDSYHTHYTVVRHTTSYTAQETAELTHVKGRFFAKAVILCADLRYLMIVLPAPATIDLIKLRATLSSVQLSLASEDAIRHLFSDCEIGAMPPFGNLYGMETIVDQQLSRRPVICFNGGTHQELIRLRFDDYKRIVQPQILPVTFSSHEDDSLKEDKNDVFDEHRHIFLWPKDRQKSFHSLG